MSKWKSSMLPNSIDQYGIDHQIWTDQDLLKFVSVGLVVGFLIGYIF